ncbi:PLP-dependent transferase [Aaosphaeria arxii CBS 175.79]|uniref:PLP-dependent transferase n=1 Tax=Aaosphaeria arxii CBS 175.79 TaxID=1450172 RepID=A0A6A5Y3M3_9PLEO|nr:PLP-dependent transferase [Aaosphaeria arxii CBS 175.79]KAF2019461.1 PLP-dependent transferase [Aaosphaeria arxii CBS 175.79]
MTSEIPIRTKPTGLSTRGASASESGSNDIPTLWEVCANLWDPNTNPEGYVSLGCAENALMHGELRDFINEKNLVDTNARAFTYGDGPFGSIPVRKALAKFFTERFGAFTPVDADQIVVTNGVTASIEHVAWALANPGEGILLGRPYYRAFLPDITQRPNVNVVPVSFGDVNPLSTDCVRKYEEALLESNKQGVKVRALMLCHPHNPLGRCYPRETIISLMKLCQKYQIHLVSDEIYSLTVWKNTVDHFEKEPVGFESVLSIDLDGIIDPGLIHVLWGTSKDFGANGIRLSAIISQSNPRFLAACRSPSLMSAPSSLAENAVTHILNDEKFLDFYIKTNQERISKAYAFAVKMLNQYDIPYAPNANAAFFLFINLSKKLQEKHPESVVDGEPHASTALVYKLLLAKQVYVVSGDEAGAEEPGWFRLVFTQPEELVEECIKRIAEAMK